MKKAYFSGAILALAMILSLGIGTASASTLITASAATNITQTSATLGGSFTTGGTTPTDIKFEYGTTGSFNNATPIVTTTATSGIITPVTITGLTPGTDYNFRIMGVNADGPSFSAVVSFTTLNYHLATIITSAPTAITSTSATLNGSFTGDQNTQTWFEYANNASMYGSSTTNAITQSGVKGFLSQTVSGLQPNTTYWFRAVAQTNEGTSYGQPTLSFTTTSATSGGTCAINSFIPSAYTVTQGNSVTFTWNTTNCTSTSIDQGFGTVSPASSGSATTGPLNTLGAMTFTLSATNGTTSDSKPVTIVVSSTGGGGTSCVINSFTASQSTVNQGSSVTLYWNTTSGCTSETLTQNTGSNIGNVTGLTSTTTAALNYSTTFTLSASNGSGNLANPMTVVVLVTPNGGGGSGYGYCSISSFSASPTSISSGQTATLYWTTNGCSSATLNSTNGYTQYEPANNTYGIATGPLSGTTTFTLTANGGSASSSPATTTVYVINSPYPYSYNCGYGSTDPSCTSQYAGDFITTTATNVGTTTARLNGLVVNTNVPFVSYFEYGTTNGLGQTTVFQNLSPVQSFNYFDTISVSPNTTYFYRAVGQINGTVIRGNIVSFTTPSDTSNPVVYAGGSSIGYDSPNNGGASSTTPVSAVTLNITNKNDKVMVGDTVEYTVAWANNTSKKLSNVMLSIILPQGFTVQQTTRGAILNPTTVTVNLDTLAPRASDSMFIQATVQPNVNTTQTLVTNGTLSYTLSSGVSDSAVGYVINHASSQTIFAGFALGSGFFPTTIFGWMITVLIILALILVARRIAKAKSGGHGGGHH